MLLLRAALIIVTLGFTRAASSSECCSILKSNITAAPNSKAYNATIYGFWSGQARDDKPTCVLQPTSREHVAAVVRTLTRWQCQFSVKGGGHTPFAGAASINDVVTIDLAKLNTISVDKNVGIAHVGAGLKWGQIYEYLETKGMMVSGGRASLVGIGGLVVGGGYSWFAPQKGFVADTVINFELVVGNGSIINVNATSNVDLFVGLKGGVSGSQSILNVIDYVAPVEAPAIYSDALAIPNLISSTMRITNVSSLTDELAGGTSTLNSRYIFVTTTFSNSAGMYETAVNISNKHLEPFKNTTGLVWSILFQPIPLIVSERSIATGGNIMGVDRNKENLTLFLVYVTWLKASDDQKFTDAAYATVDEINAVAGTLGVTNPFIYLNYAGQKQNPLAGYGEGNMEKMRTLSRKYDPQGTFQKLVKGGFKIPGMEIVVDWKVGILEITWTKESVLLY
ncbi:uncharacterized protein EAE98_007069 [Botrytis deweyae]|uniref:FAD-binding PCMH-type domain-containing protein n=1 Tax=Botrytis deweyae TaxID=2478750 RepID=A0ABQ7IIA4_9HELO|nr:uncharacterized protein EAE98_007069 [Botrytis deweyae]KAF7924981.1 hypothetical protein EAE98_007069 [Botrytis deweyae]